MAITLTETAAGEIKRYMEAQKVEPNAVLRMGVGGGGCSGLQYTLGFETDYDPAVDARYEHHGIAVVTTKKMGAAPGRDDGRFSRWPDGAGFCHRQSERAAWRRLPRLRTSLRCSRHAPRAAAR